MKIAIFSTTVDVRNGYGNITTLYCRELHKSGVDFTLFLPAQEKKRVDEMKLPYKTACVLPKPVFRIFERQGIHYLTRIDVSSFDIVHSLFSFPLCIIAARSAKRYNKPFMMGVQGTYGVLPLTRFPERFLLKSCYKQAKRIVVPSVFTRDQIIAHAGVPYSIDIVHNGVELDRFSRVVDTTSLKNQYGAGPFLVTVGGIKQRKGQDLVIRALPSILSSFPTLKYLIVGDGEMKPELQELAHELKVDDHIIFTGAKTGDDLLAHFQVADVYVHTPKVVNLNFEGFGIVYIEAGACGLPSVATDAGGIRDAVVDRKTGIVVPDGDVPGIAAAVIKLLSDTDLRTQMAKAAKEYAATHDWRYIVERFTSFYRDLV